MTKRILKYREVVFLLGALIVGVLYWLTCPKVDHVVLHRDGSRIESTLPISIPMKRGEVFDVELNVDAGSTSDFDIEIYPDDCVTSFFVNGKAVEFEKYPGSCDFGKGFTITRADIQSYLPSETSKYHLALTIRNNGGPGGMNFEIHSKSVLQIVLSVAFILFVCAGIFFFGARFNIDRRLLIIFLLGVILRFAYTQETAYNDRSHDVEAHLKYIEFVAMDHHIPDASECFTCYHPPVYYVFSAGFWKLSYWLRLDSPRTVMWFDFFVSLLTLALGLACFREFLWGGPRYIAALLWSFWPGLVLASPRIGNDVLFHAMHILVLWGCIRYTKTNNGKFILASVIAAGVAFWVKSTATISFGIIFVTILVNALPKIRKGLTRIEWSSIVVFALMAIFILYHVASAGVVGNVDEPDVKSVVYVANNPGKYLFFDVRSFLLNPYTSPTNNEMGRMFFWNYLAKTSLFGEFRLLTSVAGQWLAALISASFLVLLGFGIRGLTLMKLTKINVLLVAQALFFFASSIALCLKIPYSCSNDFRFIFPVLLSCIPWVATGISEKESSLKLKAVGGIAVAVFVICSVVLLLKL